MTTPLAAPKGLSAFGDSPASLLYADLAEELAITRRTLEKTPDSSFDWAPHPKSSKLGPLAIHLAELPKFASMVLSTTELNWLDSPYSPTAVTTTKGLLDLFDELSTKMTESLDAATWEDLAQEWTMRVGDHIIFRSAKHKVIRGFAINHMAHHRAQLGVYFRLLNLPVPGVYGPSADER